MKRKDYRALAIDILSKELSALSVRCVLSELAKTNPSALVKAYENTVGVAPVYPVASVYEVEEKCKELLNSGSYLAAIRYFRKLTGASLKDAKDFVDSLPGGSS